MSEESRQERTRRTFEFEEEPSCKWTAEQTGLACTHSHRRNWARCQAASETALNQSCSADSWAGLSHEDFIISEAWLFSHFKALSLLRIFKIYKSSYFPMVKYHFSWKNSQHTKWNWKLWPDPGAENWKFTSLAVHTSFGFLDNGQISCCVSSNLSVWWSFFVEPENG